MAKKDFTKKDKTENNAVDSDAGRRDFLKKAFIGGAGMLLTYSSKALAQSQQGGIPKPAGQAPSAAPKSFPTRIYGKTGVPVTTLALGGIFDFVSNQILLKRALDLGINYWDTANSYTNGNSELGIGQFFEKFPDARKKIFLVSKSHQFPHSRSKCNKSRSDLKRCFVAQAFSGPVVNQ